MPNNILNKEKYFEDELSIKDLITQIKKSINSYLRYKYIIIICLVIGVFSGYIYFKNQTLKYKAEINFVLDEERGSSAGGAGQLANQLGIDLGSSGSSIFAGDNLIYLFKSKLIIEKTLLRSIIINNDTITLADFYLNYVKNYSNKNLPKKKIFSSKSIIDSLNIKQIEILRSIEGDLLKEILDVKQKDKKTTVTTIEVVSKSEIFSKIFCELIAKDVSEYYVETKIKKAKINKDILQKQVDSVRYELNRAIVGTAKAIDKVYNLNPAFLVNKTPSSTRQVDIQANSAILTQLVTNLEMAKVSLRKETPLIQIIEYPRLPLDVVGISLFKIEIISLILSLFISIIIISFISFSILKDKRKHN